MEAGATSPAPPRRAPAPGLRVDGLEVVVAGDRQILGPVSLAVAPGTFTAILGPSGSGKTTLLRAMAGLTAPTRGTVTLGGEAADLHVAQLGYVPQRETVHGRLTVEEALRCAAALRLDRDGDVDAVVADVLRELGLESRAGTLIRDLSGGERRRAACGVELVGSPDVLLLDEPTSGLDPVLERRMMALFRSLASHGRSVVVVTHATASLDLCDQVVVLDPGGTPAITGAPAEAVAHVEDRAREAAAAPAPDRPPQPPSGSTHRPFALELGVLVGRYARTLTRDRRTLAAQVGQAPLIGLLIAIVFGSGALTGDRQNPMDAVLLGFMLVTGAIWLGVTAACREVVKERSIIEREFDVGLRLDAYVLSKAALLFVLSAVQVLLMVAMVAALQPLGVGGDRILLLLVVLIAVAWTSVAMGLLVSAVARSVDQASSVVPVLLIPQLLFAGALVPLARMPDAVAALAQLSYARWGTAGAGSALELEDRLDRVAEVSRALGFGQDFFSLAPASAVAALAVFTLLFLGAATVVLQLRATAED